MDCSIKIGENSWLQPSHGSPGRYVNHSCSPNAGIVGVKRVIAMRRISSGEEITIDYATTDDDPSWVMHCKCGVPLCRKIIRGIQFLPKPLRKKYSCFVSRALKKYVIA
ncbi:MAG TPA: SET domain-containing protein-lysine N-methyltransferase [Candidatus Nanoarchaeia archaeon]|nr:SET domain-containing protein-lysine N-methyltransferase [Candidatus Nanoarchaeia archaeon]